MLRKSVAAALVSAAGALPLLAVAADWDWYVDGPPIVLLALVGGYAAGAWLPRVPAVAGVMLATTGLVVANQLHQVEYHWLDDLVFFLVVVGGAAAGGAAATLRAQQVRRLERLRAELAEQERIDVAAARLEEQNRVQQQVHARLAERIAGIAVRAEGAQRSRDRDAFAVIETEARGVLDQLRAALGSLGTGEPDPPQETARTAPPPQVSPLDVAIAATLGVAMAIETTVVSHSRGPSWANAVAAFVVAAPLVVRRSRPIIAVGASCLAGVAMSAWLTPLAATVTGVGLLVVVFYTVGAWTRKWWWLLGWLVAAAGTIGMEVVSGLADNGQDGDAFWIVLLWAVGAVAVGRITAGWQERLRRIEEVVAALERGRGAAVRLAQARERQALASQLHDTVAHAMTVVCLQAGAQRRTHRDAGGALQTIATTATTSLSELRDGLDAIETSDAPLERSRIAAIGRRVGVDVAVRASTPLPAGPAAALAFRVVREAIVNIARHAPGASAQIHLGLVDRALSVEILDDGGSAATLAVGSGTGLSGIAEAVASAGGSLVWGPRSEGGFRVAAEIPEPCR